MDTGTQMAIVHNLQLSIVRKWQMAQMPSGWRAILGARASSPRKWGSGAASGRATRSAIGTAEVGRAVPGEPLEVEC